MPIERYFLNKSDNHAQYLNWGYDSVSCDYATVRYADVEDVRFTFSHSMHSTNFVKNDDTISYFIMINEIFITRTHSAFNRISSNAKAIGADIQQEFETHMNNLYRYVVPGLFRRKSLELLTGGQVEIAGMTFKSDGTIVVDGVRHNYSDLQFSLSNGSWEIKSTARRTLFGNPKHLKSITMAESNALLIEPMLSLINGA